MNQWHQPNPRFYNGSSILCSCSAPRIGQRFGEAGDREVRGRCAIDDCGNNAGRQKGEGSELADVPFALGFMFGDLSGRALLPNASVSKLFIDKIEKLDILILICLIHRMRCYSPHLVQPLDPVKILLLALSFVWQLDAHIRKHSNSRGRQSARW